MLEAGSTRIMISHHFGVQQWTISHLWTRYHYQGTVNDLSCCGWPRVMTCNQDWFYVQVRFLTDSITTAVTIISHKHPVRSWTFWRCLCKSGLHVHWPFFGPILSRHNHQDQHQWAHSRQRWTFQQREGFSSPMNLDSVSVTDGHQSAWWWWGE